MFSIIAVDTLVHLINSQDPETQRLALQTLELLAIENAEIVIARVGTLTLLFSKILLGTRKIISSFFRFDVYCWFLFDVIPLLRLG